ncbi:pyrimidine-nucleoside phosphorylase [Paenibacillus thermotolerans]|uniref:pyrimidine-nucleoside phosphorylase n=1 Tax=Paenibacillus thermotolerans TaxID=3027807 RepID=UPI0023686037|nr:MULTISPECIES: pyrimidine-nucleoside phosphorylase [unclassified Paenibacillus]
MRAVDLIGLKRDGAELTPEQIAFLVRGYVGGTIPDYQMAAWAMAVVFRGMTARETAALTMEMAHSGDMIDLSAIPGVKVDKHSTGGVGDTTTLVLAPLVAAAGVPVAKMSGRGLGHTGGTVDKLESIPGFRVELSQAEFVEQVNRIGAAVISQSGNITPADKMLYGLRDVTATVESIPLIASSIMSKKIAAGADAILLDVKTGGGAFMKTLDDSIALASAMVGIGAEVGRETVAVISDMNQPLGNAVGNALEVREALAVLRGEQGVSRDLIEVCLALGAHMLVLGRRAGTVDEARSMLQELLVNGGALRKFAEMIAAQGGDASVVDSPDRLPAAGAVIPVASLAAGYVGAIRAIDIGTAAMLLGAGRATKESRIDLSVGIRLLKRIGDRVEAGEPLAELHASEAMSRGGDALAEISRQVADAYALQSEPAAAPPLIRAVVSRNGVHRM